LHAASLGGLNSGEAVALPGAYEANLISQGYTISFDDSNPTDYVLTIVAPTAQPTTAFTDIINHLSYTNPVSDFSFNADDRVLAFTLTDNGGLDTSGRRTCRRRRLRCRSTSPTARGSMPTSGPIGPTQFTVSAATTRSTAATGTT
jgi:hypothetical protein